MRVSYYTTCKLNNCGWNSNTQGYGKHLLEKHKEYLEDNFKDYLANHPRGFDENDILHDKAATFSLCFVCGLKYNYKTGAPNRNAKKHFEVCSWKKQIAAAEEYLGILIKRHGNERIEQDAAKRDAQKNVIIEPVPNQKPGTNLYHDLITVSEKIEYESKIAALETDLQESINCYMQRGLDIDMLKAKYKALKNKYTNMSIKYGGDTLSVSSTDS